VTWQEIAKLVGAVALAVSAYYGGAVPQEQTTSAVAMELSRVSIEYARCIQREGER